MPFLGRIFTGDEELGKKDDDHRPAKDGVLPLKWPGRKAAPRARGRSLLYGLLACITIYLFVHNIPTDLGPVIKRPDYKALAQGSLQSTRSDGHTTNPPRPDNLLPVEEHYYDGPFKFYKLATSLPGAARLIGHAGVNKNVLFAASNLKSAGDIIPIACEMARWERNVVHFVIMGRDDLAIDEIKLVNGLTEECKVIWHDARPDFSRVSSAPRMEMSVAAGIGHIQNFIRPQVVLMNDPIREDAFFVKSLRSKVSEIGKSVIELPPNAAMNLMWIARLDSSSLAAWRTTYVDLLIHAPPDSSGSLLRLLKSIEAADYFGSRRPHLRIELPADIDPPTSNFIQNLVWPPMDESGAPHVSQVSLRHKIPRRTPTAEEASVHLVESFYPARPRDSHVLLLSPRVELSPLYYHYLMFILLEFKYSSQQKFQEPNNLMGITLDLPSHYLNDSQTFTPPIVERPNVRGVPSQASQAVHFLWQSPDSNAALYFGDKWIEFHSFLAARISALKSETPRRKKLISEKYPSWMEYLLELMRARGYSLLYPNFPPMSGSIATLHNELYQPPEEFSHPHASSTADQLVPTTDPSDPFSADTLLKPTVPSSHSESPLLATDFISTLPQYGDLSDLSHIPLVSYDGNVMSHASSDHLSSSFSQAFRREIGACTGNGDIWIYQMSANDLFCNLDKNTHPDESDETNDYESADPQDKSKVGTKTPVSTAQQDDSDRSQAEFAAHMGRQGGKVDDAVSTQAAATPSAKITASVGEVKKDELSGNLARPGAKEPASGVEKTSLDPGLKPADDANIKEAHDTVVMQTDHAAGRKTDDTAAMPADHVAGKKGEHAVIKIADQAAENPSREGTVKVPVEEKAKKINNSGTPKVSEEPSLEATVKTPADGNAKAPDQGESTKTAVSGAEVNADTEKEEEALGRKPGW